MPLMIRYDSDLMAKVLYQTFAEGSEITSLADIEEWKKSWMAALKVWHSPYKCLIDLNHLRLGKDPEVHKALERLFKLFSGFFLKKVVGFSSKKEEFQGVFPFDVYETEGEAREKLGIRDTSKVSTGAEDFRSTIQFENHYKQQCIELHFSAPVTLDSKEKISTIKGKLLNNLMTWHSAWNLLIDCGQLHVAPELREDIHQMLAFFKGFFLKEVVGYAPVEPKESYPFPVFRARHLAAAKLEAVGFFSGDEANCLSKQQGVPK